MTAIPELRNTLLVRADAGPRMGTGHVMRCLALAQAAQDSGCRVVYAMASCPMGVAERLQTENMEIVPIACVPGSPQDALATGNAAVACGSEWIVMDGYHFSADYQRLLKQSGRRLLAVDDLGNSSHYWADLVLNQDPIAAERLYKNREPGTRLLLGTGYALLRREFRWRPRGRGETPPVARRLLVTFGGSDPDNVTEKVIRSLAAVAVDGLEVVVLVGPGNVYGLELDAAALACGKNVRLFRNPANIPELMAACELAVTAGGSTVWELAYFAIPSIVLVVADNQAPAMETLHQRGACMLLGDGSRLSREELAGAISRLCRDRTARAALGAALGAEIDGRGAERVYAALRQEGSGERVPCAFRETGEGRG